MKTSLRQLPTLVLAGLLYLTPPAVNGQWTYVGTPGFSTGVGTYQSMALGSDGTLYVAYNDQGLGTSGKGSVMKYNGTAWTPVGTAGFTPNTAEYGSLAVGPGDSLYFSYQDGPSGQAAVMKFDGTNWVQLGLPGISTGAATYTCMEVNNAGTPYVAYIDGSTNRACVKMFDGVSWVNTGATAEVSAGNANYLSMDLDASGYPWIGFADGTSSNNMTVMNYNGTSWNVVGTAGFSASLSGIIFADLTISSSNEAYVAYANPFAGVKGCVKKFDGTTWVDVGPTAFTPGNAIFNTVTIDTDGVPYMAFMDSSVPGSKGSVMKYDGATTSWNYWGTAGFTGSGAGYLNSIMDGNTFIYVSNSDGDYGGNTSVMRFQLCNPADLPTVAAPTSICEGDSIILTITAGSLNDDSQWQWYTGSCGGTNIGTGNSIQPIITDTTVIYINGEGGCVFAGDSCTSITINPAAAPAVPTIGVSGAVLTSSSAISYQWALGGTDISGATGQVYTAVADGWYSVTVTNANGCSATSDSVFVNVTGLVENNSELARIYPVPFSQTLNITLPHFSNSTLTVSDPQGRVVYTAQQLQQNNSIDLSFLAKGVYFVTLKQENNQQVYQVVKQ